MLHLSAWAVLQHPGIGLLLGDVDRDGQPGRGRRGRVPVRVRRVHGRRTRSSRSRCTRRSSPRCRSTRAAATRRVRRSDPVGARPDGDTGVAGDGRVPRALVAGDAVLAVGNSRHDPELLAAALASLGVGPVRLQRVPLLARGFLCARRQPHARRSSRSDRAGRPVVMIVGVAHVDERTAKVAMLGIGHSVAYLFGAVVLFVLLRAASATRCSHTRSGARWWRRRCSAGWRGRSKHLDRARRSGSPPRRCSRRSACSGVGLLRRDAAHAAEAPALREAALEPTDPDLAVEL